MRCSHPARTASLRKVRIGRSAENHVCFPKLRNLQAQKVYLRQAVRLKPDFALAWNNLGIALVKQSKFEESQAAYEKALSLDPNLRAVLRHECRQASNSILQDWK